MSPWNCSASKGRSGRDLVGDIPPDYLDRLYRLGRVDRVARGLYAWPGRRGDRASQPRRGHAPVPARPVRLRPRTGASFQRLQDELLRVGDLSPSRCPGPSLSTRGSGIIRAGGPSLMAMVEEHWIEGVLLGLLAGQDGGGSLQASQQGRAGRRPRGRPRRFRVGRRRWTSCRAAARACRMENVMRPYLESLALRGGAEGHGGLGSGGGSAAQPQPPVGGLLVDC